MLKPVKSFLAVSRMLIRKPSELKLPSEDMRYLLHQSLEELYGLSIKEKPDFFNHDLAIDLTYSPDYRGFTFLIQTSDVKKSFTEVTPIYLYYQDLTADPDTGDWQKVTVLRVDQFAQESGNGAVIASYSGNNFQGINEPNFQLNVTAEFVSNQRWRIAFRHFSQDILDLEDTVPFPGEYSSLLEHMLAQAALSLVNDDSASWKAFMARRDVTLTMKVEQLKQSYLDWLNKDAVNRYVVPQPYDYKTNNPLLGRGRRRIPAQWP